jgi:hypothetical protein
VPAVTAIDGLRRTFNLWLRRPGAASIAFAVGGSLIAAGGVLAAFLAAGDAGAESGGVVLRVQDGVTQTGRIVTVATPSGREKVLVRYKTKTGTVTTSLPGRTVPAAGETVLLRGGEITVVGAGNTVDRTVTQVVTLETPVTVSETVVQTAVVTETVVVQQTVTVVQTVTETVQLPP